MFQKSLSFMPYELAKAKESGSTGFFTEKGFHSSTNADGRKVEWIMKSKSAEKDISLSSKLLSHQCGEGSKKIEKSRPSDRRVNMDSPSDLSVLRS